MWRNSFSTHFGDLPPRSHNPDRPYDACRIYGSLILNKVAGNFHITAGKSLNLPRGHVHISAFMTERDYNFTHRINKFSFGDPSPGIVHPLEGDEVISRDGKLYLSQKSQNLHLETFIIRVILFIFRYNFVQLLHRSGAHKYQYIFNQH